MSSSASSTSFAKRATRCGVREAAATTPLPWWNAKQYLEDYRSGNATVLNSGAITTTGEGSTAIFAQSIAGGGGDAGLAGGLVALGGNGGNIGEEILSGHRLRIPFGEERKEGGWEIRDDSILVAPQRKSPPAKRPLVVMKVWDMACEGKGRRNNNLTDSVQWCSSTSAACCCVLGGARRSDTGLV